MLAWFRYLVGMRFFCLNCNVIHVVIVMMLAYGSYCTVDCDVVGAVLAMGCLISKSMEEARVDGRWRGDAWNKKRK